MAEFGAMHPCFKPKNAEHGIVIGKLVSANLTVNLASGEQYADDGLAEQLSEFSSGSVAMETHDLADEIASTLYGAQVTNGEVVYNKGDEAPEGILGYVKDLMRSGVRLYRTYIYPRAKAALGNDNAQTRGNSINFQNAQTTFTIFDDDAGDWRKTKGFDSKAAAIAYVESECEISGAGTAKLSALTIGALALSPSFSSDATEYAVATTNASDAVTAAAVDSAATITIMNGEAEVTNGSAATWEEGTNTLTITVESGTVTKVYTVTVTKS